MREPASIVGQKYDPTIDADLDNVPLEKRLPYFDLGEYLVELNKVVRTDKNGVFDVFECTIVESKPVITDVIPNRVGTEAKVMIQRDATPDWKRESREKELVALLTAINGGGNLEERGTYLAGLRDAVAPGTKFRLTLKEKFKPRYSAA